MRVEVDLFSGRPNPSFDLSPADADQVRALLGQLSPAPSCAPISDRLGFRGFIVEVGELRLTVRGTLLHSRSPEGDRLFDDPNSLVDQFLRQAVRRQDPSLVALIDAME